MSKKKETYGFTAQFEAFIAILSMKVPKFWGGIGHAIDVDGLSLEPAKLAMQAVRAIAKDLGHGPSSIASVIQRLQRWSVEGKITQKQIEAVQDMIEDSEAPPPAEEVMSEIVPVIRRKMQQQAVLSAAESYASRGDFEEVQRQINAAKRLGSHDVTVGTRLGTSSFAEIERKRTIDRLSLGIIDLDAGLGGGPPRGSLTVFVGGSGGGKSMMLSHAAANSMKAGLFVVYATLELPEETVLARVKANLTGVPINEILLGNSEKAREMIEEMYPTLGGFIVKDFPAKVTTVNDIREWVKNVEEAEGVRVDVVVVDYGDKLGSSSKNDKSRYEVGDTVFEDLRLFMYEKGKWGLTGSQATRRAGKEKGRRIELDDVADSMGKVRVADLVVTLNNEDDMIKYFIAKFRHGASNWTVGPHPHDWGIGRMVP